jgi:hypothetical protein
MSATRRLQYDTPSKELSDDPRYESRIERSSEALGGEHGEGKPRGRGGAFRVELGERGDNGKGRSGATSG